MTWMLMQGFHPLPFTFWGEGARDQCTMMVDRWFDLYGIVLHCAATYPV